MLWKPNWPARGGCVQKRRLIRVKLHVQLTGMDLIYAKDTSWDLLQLFHLVMLFCLNVQQNSVLDEKEHLQVYLRVRPFSTAESNYGEARVMIKLHGFFSQTFPGKNIKVTMTQKHWCTHRMHIGIHIGIAASQEPMPPCSAIVAEIPLKVDLFLYEPFNFVLNWLFSPQGEKNDIFSRWPLLCIFLLHVFSFVIYNLRTCFLPFTSLIHREVPNCCSFNDVRNSSEKPICLFTWQSHWHISDLVPHMNKAWNRSWNIRMHAFSFFCLHSQITQPIWFTYGQKFGIGLHFTDSVKEAGGISKG